MTNPNCSKRPKQEWKSKEEPWDETHEDVLKGGTKLQPKRKGSHLLNEMGLPRKVNPNIHYPVMRYPLQTIFTILGSCVREDGGYLSENVAAKVSTEHRIEDASKIKESVPLFNCIVNFKMLLLYYQHGIYYVTLGRYSVYKHLK